MIRNCWLYHAQVMAWLTRVDFRRTERFSSVDFCGHCYMAVHDHIDERCLFGPTKYVFGATASFGQFPHRYTLTFHEADGSKVTYAMDLP